MGAMRIVQVSAHFPPDFVSGGTLVPHRVARAVAEAGHESHVYAGHLATDNAPLTTWTDTPDDLAGTEVRWVTSYPWTAWDDPRNYDNPDVTADARAYFAELRPDVVHIHSLQTLGVGVLTAAKESGARVVVTMHDWWWVCARQFLADRDLRPCSLVVSCGTCACQVDAGWLRDRTAALLPHLADVDVVVAPSAAAARTYVANGVPAEKVVVGENGLPGLTTGEAWAAPVGPDGGPAAARPVRDGQVRLMFAGGTDPMKGLPVLRDALARLAAESIPGWSIDLYAVADGPANSDLGLTFDAAPDAPAARPAPVRERTRFTPDRLPDVLADHDVLVLPSIMRESHSILTREALGAGLAVVCTDTLGPEEAVEHGRNGLVVPGADAASLAAALRTLVTDPALVARLAGQGTASPLRGFADQAAELLDLYAGLADTAAADAPAGGATPAVVDAAEAAEQDAARGPWAPVSADPLDEDGYAAHAARLAGDDIDLAGTTPFSAVAGRRLAAELEADPLFTDAERLLMRRVIFLVGIQGAPLRYRAQLPAEGLRALGLQVEVRHYRDPELTDLVRWADAVVAYRVPATRQVRELFEAVRARDRVVPILSDIDDLIFDPGLRGQVHGLEGMSEDELDLWWRGVARYRTTLEQADLFVGSTTELCHHVHALTGLPARRYANGVGTLLARASDDALRRPRTPGPLRVGYFSGTTTHNADWAFVEPVLIRLMDERPDLELWLGGHLTPTSDLARHAGRVRTLPFAAWHDLPGLLRDVDVCLAPLTEDSQFNEAKSAIKWLEAALVETAVVASPTEPFRESVEHGRTGFLPQTRDGWYEAVAALLDDEVLRRRMGTQARREALLRWSPHVQGRVYLDNLLAAARIVRFEGPRRPTDWVPVQDDEPLSAAEAYVEPYALPSGVPDGIAGGVARARTTFRRTGVGRKLSAAKRVYDAEGAAAVATRARTVVGRTLAARRNGA